MLCLGADHFAEDLLDSSGADAKRVEARGTKWNFDVGMDSGISGPPVAPRPDEGTSTAKAQVDIPTVPPNAPPPEVHVPEVRAQGVHVKVLRIGAL